MNLTATIDMALPYVALGPSHLLFEGRVDELDWHQHSFVCVLIGTEAPFVVEWDDHSISCEILLVPPALNHKLQFSHNAMCSLYFPPHERDFATLAHAAAGMPRPTPHTEAWNDALRQWRTQHDASALKAQIMRTWGTAPNASLDARIMRLLRAFWRGEQLDDSTAMLAASVGLSPSRLTHLFREQTSSSLRQLRRGYRFWQAAHAMIRGTNFTEAAHAADFADAAHFSRAFRDAYGIAPSKILRPDTTWHHCPAL